MELIFFLFLFPSFCHSVVSIVSDGRNQSSFMFFYVVFELLYGCVKYNGFLMSLFNDISTFLDYLLPKCTL